MEEYSWVATREYNTEADAMSTFREFSLVNIQCALYVVKYPCDLLPTYFSSTKNVNVF